MMNGMSPSRRRWSWRSCFAMVKHNQKSKKQSNQYSNQNKSTSNEYFHLHRAEKVNENSNVLCDLDQSKIHRTSDSLSVENEFSSNDDVDEDENDQHFLTNDQTQSTTALNPKSLPIGRSTPLDAIAEEANEDISDDSNETVRLCCDRDIIKDCHDLLRCLLDLSQINHIIIQFNDHGHFHGEFQRQMNKLNVKIDDIERTAVDMPRDAELLEAKYSSLLATIENLSLLLKLTQISSCRSLISRLLLNIEQRMDQLTKIVQLSFLQRRQQRNDLSDDDFLSFRSAFSSYEHLLNISS